MIRRLATPAVVAVLTIALAAVAADAHDLFLRPRDFVVRSGSAVQVRVLNGTFTSSEAIVARERLRDLTVVGPAGITHPDRSAWSESGKESEWRVQLGDPGTYVLGASLDPKTIRLTGAQFNQYLKEDGLPDVLAARRSAGQLDVPAHERYAKHVKALVRVTRARTGGASNFPSDTAYRVVLGYPAELIPLDDPYVGVSGRSFRVRALVDGQPVRDQVVLAGGRTVSGKELTERQFRTDAAGIVNVGTRPRGVWYVKFIKMRQIAASTGDSVTHESKWATLTFARP